MSDTYLGLPVLDFTEPDRADGTADQHGRRVFELNTQTGARAFDYPGPSAAVVRDFEWVAFSRAEVKVMLDFIDGRRGRAVPFWLRTYERCMKLTEEIGDEGSSIFIEPIDYALTVFPQGPGRRHIAILRSRVPVVPWLYRKVVAAFPAAPFPIDIEEVLDLDQSFEGTGGIESASTIAYLRYCRLDSDEVRVEWSGGQFARCRLPVREIPRETP